MSKTRRKFKGDDGKWYYFILRNTRRGGERVRSILVKYHSRIIKAFKIGVGAYGAIEAFKAWVASGFAAAKGSILLFTLAGFV